MRNGGGRKLAAFFWCDCSKKKAAFRLLHYFFLSRLILLAPLLALASGQCLLRSTGFADNLMLPFSVQD